MGLLSKTRLLFKKTNNNIAQRLATKYNTGLVSGMKLPMTLRLSNDRDEERHH